MRRRRQKNTLLPKMIGLAVLINAILLPILAHFGAFKSISGGQRLTPVELVKLPPVEKRPTPPKKQAAKLHPAGRKSAARPAATRRAPSGPLPVKVVAASGPAPGSGTGTGDSGIAPSDSGPTTPPAAPVTPPPPTPVTPPPAPLPTPAPPPAPTPTPPAAPVATDPVILSQPQPVMPDDLNFDDIHGSFRALFAIHADGSTDVKMISSTGNARLDTLALEVARRWQFRPATPSGKPVLSYERLEIQFYPT